MLQRSLEGKLVPKVKTSSEQFGNWRYELQPRQLVGNLTAGLIIGLIAVAVSTSLAVLIYGSEMEAFLINGIGLALLSSAIVGLTVTLTSSLPGVYANLQDTTSVLLAVVAAGIVAALPGVTEEVHFITVAVTLALITLATAGSLFTLGALRLGRLVRYLPYPVIGGFLAGTGWLLFVGGLGVMAGVEPNLTGLAELFTPDRWVRWVPGFALALVFLLVTSRTTHFLVWPGLLLGTVALFYLVMGLSGAAPADWRAQGLLLGPFPDVPLLRTLNYRELGPVHWNAVLTQIPTGMVVIFISILGVLLNSTGLELVTESKIDLNHELRSAGLGTLFAGLAGGMVGYHTLSFSALNYRVGSGGRVAGLVAVGVIVVTLLLGASFLAYIPTLLVGGLLAFLGLSFLFEWLYSAYFKLPKPEYLIVWLILLVIIAFGFLQGVGVGALAAVALFVVAYSRTEVVRHALTGTSYRSRVSRDAESRRFLDSRGDSLLILRLQGFLFFGTAHNLLETIEMRLDKSNPAFVLLDFERVTGLDTTALLSFEKLAQLAATRNFILALTGMSFRVARSLAASKLTRTAATEVFDNLDVALEWCETQLLDARPRKVKDDLRTRLTKFSEGTLNVEGLFSYLERREVSPGDYLIHQGDPPTTLYFIESGQVTARLEGEGVRLETMRGGSVVGELGFYTGTPRTASVITDEASVIYQLNKTALARMTEKDPRLTAAFHNLVVQLVAQRVGHLMRVVEALER